MESRLAWLDYSENDRRRMHEVIDLFREHDTRDELGIGSVRDALSETLFPGTSTIQTRPRYLLLVPWVFLRLERERISSAQAASRARRSEVDLIDSLVEGGKLDGVIGRDARAELKRLPSEVYWSGLGSYGIRRFSGSIGDYFRGLDSFHRRAQAERRAENDELYERMPAHWDSSLPSEPSGLWESATLDLLADEAEYLRDRIVMSHPDSMFAQMLLGTRLDGSIPFPWLYQPDLTDETSKILHHARMFSEVIHGAALLYNVELARASEQQAGNSELVDHYDNRLTQWEDATNPSAVSAWDRLAFWELVALQNPRVPARTRTFVDEWIDIAAANAARSDRARALIHDREGSTKGGQARLSNPRQLEMWNGAAGTGRLDFRWPTARTFTIDIQAGLRRA